MFVASSLLAFVTSIETNFYHNVVIISTSQRQLNLLIYDGPKKGYSYLFVNVLVDLLIFETFYNSPTFLFSDVFSTTFF